MKVGSLFAGIGGFDLAAKWAGLETAWYSEIDPYACAVMQKQFPGVPNLGDIIQIETAPYVDILCGGFPCQDISFAGKGAGIEGERSGLWAHYARLIAKLTPAYILIENVSALRSRGLGRVLRDLLALGYDAEWHCVPAAYVGAPHRRDRIWIVATRRRPNAHESRLEGWFGLVVQECARQWAIGAVGTPAPDPSSVVIGANVEQEAERFSQSGRDADRSGTADATYQLLHGSRASGPQWRNEPADAGWWHTEPNVGRVAHGVPSRVDRLRCLGNAIVPQVAYPFFQAIAIHDLIYGQDMRQ